MKVSVCIPTYNQASYIEETIRSCIQQSHAPFEIIVSDDCSTDQTGTILEKLKKEIACLKVIYQPVNIGMVPNTDAVLRLATGDYIVKLDSDDYLAPTYIEKLGKLLKTFPSAGYAHAAVQEIDNNGVFKRKRLLARKTGFYSSEKALKDAIYGYQAAANIIMFRKTALEQVGYVTAQTNFAEDYYLSAVLASTGFGNVYFHEILSFYRVWEDTGNIRQRRKLAEISALRKIFEEVLEPAFKHRNWSLKKLRNCRTHFACTQADCLGWKFYNKAEKKELTAELKKLSSAPKAKLYATLYLKEFGGVVSFFSKIRSVPKSILKTLYFLMVARLKNTRG